jgi:hypothetical protein
MMLAAGPVRLKYDDGDVVVVEEMFGSAAGNELMVRDGPGC